MTNTHRGACFCGTVQIETQGEPAGMGYCHCSSCRSWSAGPVNAFTLWQPQAVKVVAGADHLATFSKTDFSERQFCDKCGGHVMTNHPPIGLVDVYAATLPSLKFVPGVHVNYADTVMPMRDGLPRPSPTRATFASTAVHSSCSTARRRCRMLGARPTPFAPSASGWEWLSPLS